MYPSLMDTDHVSLIARAEPEGSRILARIVALPQYSVAVSIISYEEQMRGWIAQIAQMGSIARQLDAYSRLDRLREYYCLTPVLAFGDEEVAQFQTLWVERLRVGTMDLKIAAAALANNATLVTRNVKDLGQVPGLALEDWSGE